VLDVFRLECVAKKGNKSLEQWPDPVMRAFNKLNRETVRVMQLAEVKDMLLRQGYAAITSTPEELASLIKNDLAKWNKVVKAAGMQID